LNHTSRGGRGLFSVHQKSRSKNEKKKREAETTQRNFRTKEFFEKGREPKPIKERHAKPRSLEMIDQMASFCGRGKQEKTKEKHK